VDEIISGLLVQEREDSQYQVQKSIFSMDESMQLNETGGNDFKQNSGEVLIYAGARLTRTFKHRVDKLNREQAEKNQVEQDQIYNSLDHKEASLRIAT
jgi:hypothetical protein